MERGKFMLSRLLGIIYILMNKGTTTASELAQRFEVSTRTIYRDIDNLCQAGIPIYATKGKNGGISLTKQFVLDKMLITQEEQQQILAALFSLQETGAEKETKTLQKLGEFFDAKPMNWLAIDFSDWSDTRQKLYEDVRDALLSHKVIQFDYYGRGEMNRRTVEPVQLLFKEYTWYLRAYCRDRKALRLFKLLRIKNMEVTEEQFVPDEIWYQQIASQQSNKDMSHKQEIISEDNDIKMTEVSVLIDKKEAYRVYDRFDDSDIEVLESGDFLVHFRYVLDEWVYGLILSFGASAKVLSPQYVKNEIKERIACMYQQYNENTPKQL